MENTLKRNIKLPILGFTLIELLAVIVILAIISLIATPIVLNIINETKKSAQIRSADFYLDAVGNSFATLALKNEKIEDGVYSILENGNICLEEYDSTTKECKDTDSNLENSELIVEVKGEKPSGGTITINKGKIEKVELILSDKVIWKNPDTGEIEYKLAPGLYDKNNKLIASWDELVKKHDFENLIQNGDNAGEIIDNNYSKARKLVLSENVTKIGTSAFEDCKSLESITIPDSVTSIGPRAFFSCKNLESITIPDSVTSIGTSAFSSCENLESITVDSNNTKYDSRNNSNAIIETGTNTLIAGCKNTIIPNSVTSIGESAFFSCKNLESITIPNSVTSIGYDAFAYCSSLESITIPNSVTSIGPRAFFSCKNLESITIPNSVTSIGGSAFAYCSSLESITIPNSVTKIGTSAFLGCTSLTNITVDSNNPNYDSRNNSNAIIETGTNTLIVGCKNTIIPNSVTSIGIGAFSECSSLTSITIPNSVTSIGSDAFAYSSSLTSITIPNSVTSIGPRAFSGCKNLKTIKYKGTATGAPWNAPNATVVTDF